MTGAPNRHLRPVDSVPDTAGTAAPDTGAAGEPDRARIRIGADPEAIRVLTAQLDGGVIPDTFVTDGTPVVVEAVSGAASPSAGDDDVAMPLVASTLRPPLLASLLAEHCEILQSSVDAKGVARDEEVSPSRNVLAAVLSRRSWLGLPVLRRIITTPVLRPDGTLLQTPGYDDATGFLLASNHHLDPVPDRPTPDQVDAAKAFLLDRFLRDFPWRTPADRANYLALLATPLVRPYTRALSPFGVIEATMPGSGKTILTGCVGLLVGQRVLTWSDSEDELRKSVTTVLAEQVGVIVWDNLVEGAVIDSAVLARLVTERAWTDRRLGSNTAATFANDRLWLATGNNLRTGGDMASRTVWVRLDPDCPRPEARTGFSIPNLDTWILQPANQATVLRHLLVLILDWTAAGAPLSHGVPAMRQFTRWAQQLGGLLEHHGISGFLGNAEVGRGLDEDAAEWRGFLLHWKHIHADIPVSAADLRRSAEPGLGADTWAGSFPTDRRGQLLSVKALGKRLRGQVDRWRGDIVLRSVLDTHLNCMTYWVQQQPGSTGPPESNPQTRKPANHSAEQQEQW